MDKYAPLLVANSQVQIYVLCFGVDCVQPIQLGRPNGPIWATQSAFFITILF